VQRKQLPQVFGHSNTINQGKLPKAAKDQTLIDAELANPEASWNSEPS